MSGKLGDGINAARARAMWEEHFVKNAPMEADRFNARKHRLVALFGSKDCYSANVHTDTNDLKELVDSLVRLDRLPDETPPEGLKLLAQAWDENRGKYEQWTPRHGLTGHRGLRRTTLAGVKTVQQGYSAVPTKRQLFLRQLQAAAGPARRCLGDSVLLLLNCC